MITAFAQTLLNWYEANKRNLPWRDCNNAYFIWVSEIILQQTRVQQGLNYYLRFIEKFPDIYTLAQSSIDEVLRQWQGLGYYSRARNMHKAAQQIVNQHNGQFPVTLQEMLQIKGIGEYTAAAVLSFAYNLPYPVIDGNVFRVACRYFGIEEPIESAGCKKQIKTLLEHHIPQQYAASFNQATMEFGALQCVPRNPECSQCPLSQDCFALQQEKVSLLPLKKKQITIKTRYFHYLLIEHQNQTYIRQRIHKDIWHLLFEYPMIEAEQQLSLDELQQHTFWKEWLRESVVRVEVIKRAKHQLTHQTLHALFIKVTLRDDYVPPEHCCWIKVDTMTINHYAMPRLLL